MCVKMKRESSDGKCVEVGEYEKTHYHTIDQHNNLKIVTGMDEISESQNGHVADSGLVT